MSGITIFWGAGKIGKSVLDYWRLHGLEPDYFCDVNPEKHGTIYHKIEIIDYLRIKDFENAVVLLTLYDVSSALSKIKECDFKNNIRIIADTTFKSYEMLCYMYELKDEVAINNTLSDKRKKCIMDFTYGTELGGVQTWCYKQRSVLAEMDIDCDYLMPDNRDSKCNERECVKVVYSNQVTPFDEYVDSYIQYLRDSSFSYIVLNFPREIMLAAMIVKSVYKPDMQIIAVIHSDDDIYYDNYILYKDLIDSWCVVSDKMEQRLKRYGVNGQLIHRLSWKINIDQLRVKERLFDEKTNNARTINIGFAGRIVIPAKRIDYILTLGEMLKNKRVDCVINVAGSGESLDFMNDEIDKRGIGDYVIYRGFIDHDVIGEFWSEQDIYLSCSDYEGHSISQVEGMAMGAVPVVTDVSGARDDIPNDDYGFVLPIGDINGIAEKIEYLCNNRALLSKMSERCIKYIAEKNDKINEAESWKKVLWRE